MSDGKMIFVPAEEYAELKKNAEPVRHGHWKVFDDGMNAYECSYCKEPFVLEAGNPNDNCYKYCPNCGTKMDEV